MSDENKEWYLFIDGQRVPVSKNFFKEYRSYDRKERYFMIDRKRPRKRKDKTTQAEMVLPSLEVSLDDFYVGGNEPPTAGPTVEEQVLSACVMEAMMDALNDRERYVICGIYIEGKSERDLAAELFRSQYTVNHIKNTALTKLRTFLTEHGYIDQ